ncbi:sulfite exporter TauE/SafE family protein [Alteromonas sp. CYL-A6]|uniref:sulfite exporter TauE/SafE family protein n=1 Tax=Alteromonas nitratireducens TaxID=3390813 RepID=UPI0034B807D0
MDPIIIIFISCAVLGLVVGTLAGMLGIGGGLIIVPVLSYLLVHVLDMSADAVMPVAVATSLSTIIFTGASSAYAHYRLGNLTRHLVLYTGAGIALGAIVGAQIASHIDGHLLRIIFAVLVILIALQMIFGKPRTSENAATPRLLSVIGGGTGIFSALMGIGGGALLVPALVWFQVNIRHAIGCAAVGGMVIAVFGTLSFIVAGWNKADLPAGGIGFVYLPATLGIVATSVFTANFGAKLGQRVNTRLLKQILAALLVVVSIRMIVGLE